MSDHEDIVEDLREPYQAMRFSKAEIADRIEQLEADLAAAQATIEAVKAWNVRPAGGHYVAELFHILSRTDGAALEQVKADTWDEALDALGDHMWDGDGGPLKNPYRREDGDSE